MKEIEKRFVQLTINEEKMKKADRDANAQKRTDRENQEKNCLECLYSEKDSRGISADTILRATPDILLGEICDEVRAQGTCRNRVCFENDPKFERPHLSTLYTMEGIRQMCNGGSVSSR